jgi:hypothetical protein
MIDPKDLQQGTLVQIQPLEVYEILPNGLVQLRFPGGAAVFTSSPLIITSIVSQPETPEAKIKQLEKLLAERDARIAELELLRDRAVKVADALNMKHTSDVIDGTTSPAPEVLGSAAQFCGGIVPQRWSRPLDRNPNLMLPGGSYQFEFSYDGGWIDGDVSASDIANVLRHRIAMFWPIKWGGGKRPVPGHWEVGIDWSDGSSIANVTADTIDWSGPFVFRVISDRDA